MDDGAFMGERLTTELIFCYRFVYSIVLSLDLDIGEGDFGRVGLITKGCS